MTQYEKIISEYIDPNQYYEVTGFYHVVAHAWEIETRRLVDEIVEREGYTKGLERIEAPTKFLRDRTTYADSTKETLAYAIPRRFYKQAENGALEVDHVDVVWFTCRLDENGHPVDDGDETIIQLTDDDDNRLMELTRLYDEARNDYEALRRIVLLNLFNAEGISTADDILKGDDFQKKVKAVQDLAYRLLEAVTLEDAKRLQEIQYRQITQHWQVVSLTSAEAKKELIYFYCPQYHDADEKAKTIQLACVYSNFADNIATTIPELYLYEQGSIYHGKKSKGTITDEEEGRLTLIDNCLEGIRKKRAPIRDSWFNEIGGDYVKDQDQEEAEEKALERLADNEAVIQDYTSPKKHIYQLAKTARGILGEPRLADDITDIGDGQLQFTFAVSRADAKIERAVLVEIADSIEGLTKFDRSVINAVFSVIEAGNDTFTSKQVAMQNTQNKKPRPNVIGAYTKSIEKMRRIVYSMDVTEHLIQKGLIDIEDLEEQEIKRIKKDDNLLPLAGTTLIMNNGTEVKGYKIKNTPLLLAYGKDTKQLHVVANEVLNVPVRLDETALLIRDYLIQQIGVIYNPHSRISNTMLISTILDYAGVDLTGLDRNTKKRHVDKILLMLKYWNGEDIKGVEPITENYIVNGYTLNKNGKSIESITIHPKAKG